MSDAFEFATAGRIVFGAGRLNEIGQIARGFGCRVLLVTGRNPDRAALPRAQLVQGGCDVTPLAIAGEPTIEVAERAATLARTARCDVVIGFGGGSVIDAAKAVAALATNPGPALNYLEVIGQGRPLMEDSLPMIAIPTTAGTGAEVTRNAVLHSPEAQVKVSLRGVRLLPRVALVDPDTLRTLPDEVATSTGMDALTQLIEAFVSCRANPMTDALCREALPRIARSLERVVRDREDSGARTDVAFASLCSGVALANAGLGAVHGLAAPLGGMFAAPHGAVCAALLWPVMKANLEVAQTEPKHVDVVARFTELAGLLTGGRGRMPRQVLDWIAGMKESLKVRGLGQLGVRTGGFRLVAERAKEASSMKGNPVSLSVEKLRDVLSEAL